MRSERQSPLLLCCSSAVILLTIAVSWHWKNAYVLPNVQGCWDCSERVNQGLRIYLDVKERDARQFLSDTDRQRTWPFLHTWLTALSFAIFGPSYMSARYIALFSYAGAALLMFAVPIQGARGVAGVVGGLLAWALFVSSPFMAEYSGNVMLEVPGLFLALAYLSSLPWAYTRRRGPPVYLCSLLCAMLLLLKYNYGFLTLAAALLWYGWRHRNNLRRGLRIPFFRHHFGLVALLFLLWILPSFKHKVVKFVDFAINQDSQVSLLSWQWISFYPDFMLHHFFVSMPLGAICLILCGVGMYVMGVRFWSPIAWGFLVHFLAVQIHPFRMERFLALAGGLLFVLVGEVTAKILSRDWFKPLFARATAAAAGVMVLGLIIPPATQLYCRPVNPGGIIPFDALRFCAENTDASAQLAVLGPNTMLEVPLLEWGLMTMANSRGIEKQKYRERLKHLYYRSGSWENAQALPRDERIKDLSQRLDDKQLQQMIVVLLEDQEILSAGWFTAWYGAAQVYARDASEIPGWYCAAEKVFPDIAMKIQVFKREFLNY
jgi:hypothetical protein